MTISGFQLEETIDRETSGPLEQLLLAIGNEYSPTTDALFIRAASEVFGQEGVCEK